jgi:hypothetical protein
MKLKDLTLAQLRAEHKSIEARIRASDGKPVLKDFNRASSLTNEVLRRIPNLAGEEQQRHLKVGNDLVEKGMMLVALLRNKL